jgi:hypothetical protein
MGVLRTMGMLAEIVGKAVVFVIAAVIASFYK